MRGMNYHIGCRRARSVFRPSHVLAVLAAGDLFAHRKAVMMERAQGNGYNPEQIEGYLKEIDSADERLGELKSEYMNRCKGPRSDIAGVLEAAKDAGVPMRAFRTIVKNRRLNRAIEANAARLEPDDAAEYDKLITDLGDFIDLPLGQAALDRARPNREQALDSLSTP
jgi:hypothetical protein